MAAGKTPLGFATTTCAPREHKQVRLAPADHATIIGPRSDFEHWARMA